jgi:hypothetical protein
MGAAAFGVAVRMVAVVVMVGRRVESAKRGGIVGVVNDPGGRRQHLFSQVASEQKAVGGKEEGQQDEAGDDRSMKGDSYQMAGLPVKFAHTLSNNVNGSQAILLPLKSAPRRLHTLL